MIVANYQMSWENSRAIPRPGQDSYDNAIRTELADCVTRAVERCSDAFTAATALSDGDAKQVDVLGKPCLARGEAARVSYSGPAAQHDLLPALQGGKLGNAKLSLDEPNYHLELKDERISCYGREGLFEFRFGSNGTIAVTECS